MIRRDDDKDDDKGAPKDTQGDAIEVGDRMSNHDDVFHHGGTDVAPDRETFLRDVVEGLSKPQKAIPAKYLYDLKGSQLFDRICDLDEYYPTRTEIGLMRSKAGEIADVLGEGCVVIEYGSGSSLKTPILLDALRSPAAYVPVDISREHLLESAAGLSRAYGDLRVHPICADFTQDFEVPSFGPAARRRVVYFPGSTIGNFPPAKATACLESMTRLVGSEGGVLIGVDLKKDPAILEPAYDDGEGVTRAFTMNLLTRMNRELGTAFDSSAFAFKSFWNSEASRIEMHIESRRAQTVRVDGAEVAFAVGETIHTESSHKFSLEQFAEIAASAGLKVERVWRDSQNLFSVQYLSVSRVAG
jgi:dimethylhistidine N-methyltransferase